jgi:hypothetical protein
MAVFAPRRAPLTAPLAAPVAAPERAFRTVVTACAMMAPAFLVTGCVPARAFVLVLLARFALTRLVPTFFAGLPLRARFFFAEAFFRLEGTAFRALDVLRREPAAPLFFGLRVGMAISPPFNLRPSTRPPRRRRCGARRTRRRPRLPAFAVLLVALDRISYSYATMDAIPAVETLNHRPAWPRR